MSDYCSLPHISKSEINDNLPTLTLIPTSFRMENPNPGIFSKRKSSYEDKLTENRDFTVKTYL